MVHKLSSHIFAFSAAIHGLVDVCAITIKTVLSCEMFHGLVDCVFP